MTREEFERLARNTMFILNNALKEYDDKCEYLSLCIVGDRVLLHNDHFENEEKQIPVRTIDWNGTIEECVK